METKRAGWRAPLPTRVLLAANAVLVTYLVAVALTEGGGWQDAWRDLWAALALVWLVVLCGWFLRRVHRERPI